MLLHLAALAPLLLTVQPVPELTWDTLDQRFQTEAEAGFAGVLLITRGDEIVFNKAAGLANHAEGIPNSPETIFAIGSTPIDFTKAAILLLAERGQLRLDDPITKYFEAVPEDKQAITIEHLMTGRSGLRDFHGLPSDPDPDHAWIDREEAVRRILNQKLLFTPGKGEEHSHSAWGLLAAIVEIVSGDSYQDFTRNNLFKPAGMNDTMDFGVKYPLERMAIGYGDRTDGEINAPPFWGRTSWLVLGSGGMVSTAGDMLRWHRALHDGRLLSDESLNLYFDAPGTVMAGGDMYGFEITYSQGPDTLFILMSNNQSDATRDRFMRLTRDLARLVTDELRPPYSLGIEMSASGEGITISNVLPGSAAQRDGLKVGDILRSANGQDLMPRPMEVLDPALRSGEAIVFVIERGGQQQEVTVTPKKR